MLEIVGQVNRGHLALTQPTLYAVAALQGCVQAGYGIGHQTAALIKVPVLCDTRAI
jgi:hypothetical protein